MEGYIGGNVNCMDKCNRFYKPTILCPRTFSFNDKTV